MTWIGIQNSTHPSHQPSPIIPIHSTLPWLPRASDITLSSEKDRMHKSLGFVQVIKQKYCRGDERQEDGQVVREEVVREVKSHFWDALSCQFSGV